MTDAETVRKVARWLDKMRVHGAFPGFGINTIDDLHRIADRLALLDARDGDWIPILPDTDPLKD